MTDEKSVPLQDCQEALTDQEFEPQLDPGKHVVDNSVENPTARKRTQAETTGMRMRVSIW